MLHACCYANLLINEYPSTMSEPSGSIAGVPPAQDLSSIDYSVTGLAADRGPIIIGVVTALYTCTIIALVLRLVARYLSKTKLWWDDYLAIAAWVSQIHTVTLTIIPRLIDAGILYHQGICHDILSLTCSRRCTTFLDDQSCANTGRPEVAIPYLDDVSIGYELRKVQYPVFLRQGFWSRKMVQILVLFSDDHGRLLGSQRISRNALHMSF